jgi:hypothetical protein
VGPPPQGKRWEPDTDGDSILLAGSLRPHRPYGTLERTGPASSIEPRPSDSPEGCLSAVPGDHTPARRTRGGRKRREVMEGVTSIHLTRLKHPPGNPKERGEEPTRRGGPGPHENQRGSHNVLIRRRNTQALGSPSSKAQALSAKTGEMPAKRPQMPRNCLSQLRPRQQGGAPTLLSHLRQ